MKPKAAKRGAARLLRRGMAGMLALAGMGMAAVAAGLMTVEVAPHSRREHSVALTARGKDVVSRGDALFAGARGDLLAAVPPADLAAAIRVLATLNGLGHPGEHRRQ